METLQIEVGQARDTLNLLRDLIQQQRYSLQHEGDHQLEGHLATWEELLTRVQLEIARERSAQLSRLYEFGQSINASLDWEQTIEAIIDAVVTLTGAERGMLILVDDGELSTHVTRNATGEAFTPTELQFSHSIVRRALESGKPLLTSNAQLDPRFKGSESIVAYGLRSILCTPLYHQETPLGAIYLENRARAGIFTQNDLLTLTAFANQATTAMVNAQVYAETNRALRANLEQLHTLQEMGRQLNASLNFDHVMQQSIQWATVAVEAGAGALGLIAEEGIRWVAQVGQPHPETHSVNQSLYQRKPSYHPEQLIVPLLREGRPMGIYYLEAGERLFTANDLDLVLRVANHAAIAVENARLYEALRLANQAKSEFVSLVSHELRTPMTSIRGYADMLNKGMVGDLSPQQQEFIEAIRRNVERMRILVSDLLDVSRIETGRLKLAPREFDLEEALDAAIDIIHESLEQKQQVFICDLPQSLPPVLADPDRITQVLINLLGNATKYTPHGGTVAVRAWISSEEPDFVRCAIIDTGIGISQEDQRQLFTKFFRSENPAIREQPGTGLGLVIAKSLIELQGGRIWLESEADKGSSFFFTIPLAP